VPPPPPMGVGPQVPEESGRNVLALVSLIASLFFPLGIVLSLLGVVARSNGWPMALPIFASIGASLTGIVGIPASLCTIATGHVAWIRRKRYSQAGSLGWMAILGLVIVYVSMAFVLAVIAIIIIALLQGG
jgi:cellulose synthase/poly-beta-1,6-N-acetylglucosamine synthase-like glycosyltransferase